MMSSTVPQLNSVISQDDHGISDLTYSRVSALAYEYIGIEVDDRHRSNLTTRLRRRMRSIKIDRFEQYIKIVESGEDQAERQEFIDLLTTNETYFFREPNQFKALETIVMPTLASQVRPRIWSAACSEGAEVYTIAMLLQHHLGQLAWKVVGSDVCMQMLENAREALYSTTRVHHIPKEYLMEYCFEGTGPNEGFFTVHPDLLDKTSFIHINLNNDLPVMQKYDVVFLRNVLIYFSKKQQRKIIGRVLSMLKRGGYFFIGTSESLNAEDFGLVSRTHSVYEKL